MGLGVEGGGVSCLGDSMLVLELDLERSNTSLKMWLLMKSMIWMLLLQRYSVFIRALSNYSWASSTMLVVGLYDRFKLRIFFNLARILRSSLDDFTFPPFLWFFHKRHKLIRMYSLQSWLYWDCPSTRLMQARASTSLEFKERVLMRTTKMQDMTKVPQIMQHTPTM